MFPSYIYISANQGCYYIGIISAFHFDYPVRRFDQFCVLHYYYYYYYSFSKPSVLIYMYDSLFHCNCLVSSPAD